MATAMRVGDPPPANKDQKRTDWLGNEFGIGDLVIYAPRGYGQVNMHLAEVVRFTPQRIVVQPIASARHGRETAYRSVLIDKRNGKRIPNKWSSDNAEHKERAEGVLVPDGTYMTREQWYALPIPRPEATYTGCIWKPYVLELKVRPQPVALQVVKNVTKWNGTVPPEFGTILQKMS